MLSRLNLNTPRGMAEAQRYFSKESFRGRVVTKNNQCLVIDVADQKIKVPNCPELNHLLEPGYEITYKLKLIKKENQWMPAIDSISAIQGKTLEKPLEIYYKKLKTKIRKAVQEPRPSPKKNPPVREHHSTSSRIKVSVVMEKEKKAHGNFIGPLSIYIDEKLQLQDNTVQFLGGLIWDGGFPENTVLPLIEDHQRDETGLKKAVENLLACNRALPFLFPISYSCKSSEYFDLFTIALRVLLGWIIPCCYHPRPKKADIRVYSDRMTGFDDGTDKTDYFRGLFSSPRYRWADIKLVGWIDTDRRDSYVPYADALIYAATSSKVEFNFKSLPGYVELYPELPDQLEMVENLAENGAVDVLLDLAATIGIYRIFDYVADKLKQSVGAEKRLAEKAYIELDRRYDDARRDLDALARQMKAVEYIFGEPREGFTNRVRYHWTLVKLQRANHEGRPEEGERLEAELADIRQAVLKDGDAELLVHGELYRMVSLCDRLEFEAALQLAQQTLPLASRKQSRGRVLSSMGQHLSFLGRFTEAEEKYRMALDLFARADLTDEERAREITQTTTYRVMNATDGKFDPQTIWSHYQELIDPNLEETMASTMESPYLHHLMVRTMFWLQNQEKINWYLERRGEWLSGSYHPWELVNLYRAIFLVQAGDRDGARSHFEKAYAICQSGGAILQLIGAMILLVQRRLLGRSTELDGLFQSSLTRVQEQLPEAVSHVDRLQGLYESPNAENLSELLVLPFNYH